MTDRIGFYSRDDEYGWLSNFHRSPMIIDGKRYMTNEHYYQSQKASAPEFQEWIRLAPNPYLAMKAGRLLRAGKPGELRQDWDDPKNPLKLIIMEKGTRSKYQDQLLRLKLLQTDNAYLFENSPTDDYWGGALPNSKNHLGNIIMKIREECKKA